MTAPADRVQLTKQESTSGGGDAADSDEFLNSCPLEPNEDAPEVQGVFFQPPSPSVVKDEEAYIARNAAGDLCFKDENTTELPLSALGGLMPLEKVMFAGGCFVIVGCDYVGSV